MKKRRILLSLAGIFIAACAVGYYFMFGGGADKKIKEEYDSYVSLINVDHKFDEGVKGLETLTKDAAKKVVPTIKTDIKTAKQLKNAEISLKAKDVDSAKDSIENAKKNDNEDTFSPAINWLEKDIKNYQNAKNEIENLTQNNDFSKNLSQILEKYSFNYSELKQSLFDFGNKIEEKMIEKEKEAAALLEQQKKEQQEKAKKKKSDVELGGPNPALLNDSNSLPADAQGIGGLMTEDAAKKYSEDMVTLYQGYLLNKYEGDSIKWTTPGESFEIIRSNGKNLKFTTKTELYGKVANRLVTGTRLTSSEGNEFLYKT